MTACLLCLEGLIYLQQLDCVMLIVLLYPVFNVVILLGFMQCVVYIIFSSVTLGEAEGVCMQIRICITRVCICMAAAYRNAV